MVENAPVTLQQDHVLLSLSSGLPALLSDSWGGLGFRGGVGREISDSLPMLILCPRKTVLL